MAMAFTGQQVGSRGQCDFAMQNSNQVAATTHPNRQEDPAGTHTQQINSENGCARKFQTFGRGKQEDQAC